MRHAEIKTKKTFKRMQITKAKKLLLLVLLIQFNFLDTFAQTEEILHDRYWSYRERFRKHFTIINEKSGSGLPFSDILLQDWIHTNEVDNNGNLVIPQQKSANTHGKLNVGGDVTAYMAEYLGILSTEYWLLKYDKQEGTDEFKAVLNELYFVINAIERLDKYSLKYYRPDISNPITNADGFFVRDDAPPTVVNAFKMYDYPKVIWETSINAQGWPLIENMSVLPPAGNKYIGLYEEVNNNHPVRFTLNERGEEAYYDERTRQSNMNEMSMDQLIGVLFGFKNVMKFVDDYVEVDPDGPTGPLPSKNLKNWVKELTNKLMEHLSQTTYDIPQYDEEKIEALQDDMCARKNKKPWVNDFTKERFTSYLSCRSWSSLIDCHEDRCTDRNEYKPKNPKLAAHANYVITNPHIPGDKGVYRGSMAFGFGYPLEKLGEEITGKNYPSVKVTLSAGANLKRTAFLGIPGLTSYLTLGRQFEPPNPDWWRDAYNFIGKNEKAQDEVTNSTAAGMFIWLPAASGTWTQKHYDELMTKFKRREATLFWAVLNDEEPLLSSADISSTLLSSDCSGPQNTKDRYTNKFNRTSYFSKIASDGNNRDDDNNIKYTVNYVVRDKYQNTDKDNEVWFNGMDWMLIYNYYRIAIAKNSSWENSSFYKKQITNQKYSYKNDYCPCKSSLAFYKDRNVVTNPFNKIDPHSVVRIHSMNEHIVNQPSFDGSNGRLALGFMNVFNPQYEELGIHLSDWLTTSFSINNNGLLKPLGNLTVCNSGIETPNIRSYSTVTIKNGGTLSTEFNSNPNVYKTIRFGKNSKLVIENGGVLNVENNTMVLIDEGAVLTFYAGAKIKLNGPNAVLKFNQSLLRLENNAVFNIEGGTSGHGYVHFHNNYYPNSSQLNISAVSTAKFSLSGSNSTRADYYNDKILYVTGNLGIVTNWDLKEFSVKNGFIAMGKGSKIISNAVYTSFEHCNINVLENSEKSTYLHGGIEIPGRINLFNDVQIWNAVNAIAFYNRGSQGRLNINACYFNNCINPIYQVGGIFKIDNCYLPNANNSNRLGIFGINKGIQAIGMLGNSSLRNSEISISNAIKLREGTITFKYQGSGNLYMWGNKLTGGIVGLHAFDTKVRLKCNTFDYNGWNSKLMRSPLLAIGNGYNKYLKNNAWGHIQNYGQTWTSFTDGFNEFTFLPANPSGVLLDFDLTKNSPFNKSLNTFYGQNNGFELMTLDQYTSSSSNPKYRFTTYELAKINLSFNYLPDLYTSIGNTITDNCTEVKEYADLKLYGFEYPVPSDPMKDYNQAQSFSKPSGTKNPNIVINSGRYSMPTTFETLGNLIQKNFVRIYVTDSAVNDTAIHELCAVLSNNSARPDLKDSANLVDMYQLYSMVNDAYKYKAHEVNSADSTQSTFSKIAPVYTEIDSMFQYIWKESSSSGSVWSKFRNEIVTDWAQLNRLSNNKEKAISILDSGIYYADDSNYTQGYQDLKCVNQFEILLQNDSNLMLDSAIKMCPCIKTVFKDKDTSYYSNRDTIVHYCDWQQTALKKPSSIKFMENSASLVHIEDLMNPYLLIDKAPTGIYDLKAGKFKFHYFDSVNSKISTLTLHVIADSIFIKDSSLTAHYCDMSNYGIESKWHFNQPSLPFMLVNDSNQQIIKDEYLSGGSYTNLVFDTLNCTIYKIKMIVIGDTVTNIVTKDTSLFEYGSNPSNIDSFYLHLGKYAYYVPQIGNSLLSNRFNSCHISGLYQIVVPDSSNCKAMIYKVTLFSDSMVIKDTTINYDYCNFNDSTYKSGYFYFPSHDLMYDMYKIGSDTSYIQNYFLTEGQYQVNYYDTTICRIFRESITVTKETASTTLADSVIGYCGLRFTGISGCAPYIPVDSMSFRIKMVYPDTMSIFDTCLIAGRYIVSIYDDNNCLLKKYNLSVYDSFYCDLPNLSQTNLGTKEKYKKYLVFPNPSTGQLNIVVSEDESIKEIRLIDYAGKLVKHFTYQDYEHEKTIIASELSQGIYMIQAITTGNTYQSKIQILTK